MFCNFFSLLNQKCFLTKYKLSCYLSLLSVRRIKLKISQPKHSQLTTTLSYKVARVVPNYNRNHYHTMSEINSNITKLTIRAVCYVKTDIRPLIEKSLANKNVIIALP